MFDRERYKALLHYICRYTAREPEKLGLTKLHKILWFIDGQSFLRHGETITGENYIKHRYGPFSVHADEVISELRAAEGEQNLSAFDVIWQIAELGEPIPHYAMLAAKLAPITAKDIEWANEEIARHH